MSAPTEAEQSIAGAARFVWLVARREVRTRTRAKSFVIGTAVFVVILIGYLLLQGLVLGKTSQTRIGLVGQANGVAKALRENTARLGIQVDISKVDNVADGTAEVAKGSLDVLVSGAPDALHVTVDDGLDDRLRVALDGVVQQQALDAQLAEAGLRPADVHAEIDAAHAKVIQLRPADQRRGQRVVVGVAVAFLLYFSLVTFGTLVAQGVVEEKSSRVVEVLLAAVRPWQLLLGKVVGLGAVGLLQLLIVAVIGVPLSLATGALSMPSLAFGAFGSAVLWYLLGFFLFATVFGAAGSLVSRQEDLASVTAPLVGVIAVAFVVGINLLIFGANGAVSVVLSVLPPFAPVLMPGRMAAGMAPAWQVGLAVALTVAAIAGLTAASGRIYRNSVLHIGGRIRVRDLLR